MLDDSDVFLNNIVERLCLPGSCDPFSTVLDINKSTSKYQVLSFARAFADFRLAAVEGSDYSRIEVAAVAMAEAAANFCTHPDVIQAFQSHFGTTSELGRLTTLELFRAARSVTRSGNIADGASVAPARS